MELRAVRPDEVAEYIRTIGLGFGHTMSEKAIELRNGEVEPDRTRVVFDGDRMVATSGAFTFRLATCGGGNVGLPGVLSAEVDSKALSRARKGVLEVVDRALEGLVEMRAHEGAATARDLARHAGRIAKVVARIERRMPKVIAGHQQALRQRVDELLETGHRAGGASVRPEDLAREVALIADRMDVSEELARLQSHLAQLDKLMSKPGAVGRALEFLVQEFLREANTVGSKCNDARVAHEVIELKTLIERLREQVMNVE